MAHHQKPRSGKSAHLDADTVNNIVQTIALIGAGLWAVYTFIYQSEIAPSLAPPTVSLTSTIEKTGKQGQMTAIRATLTRSNPGQNSVRILALTYNAVGIKEHFRAGENPHPGFLADTPQSAVVNVARDYGPPERQEVILRNGILFAGAHPDGSASALSPEESVTRDIIFYADRSRYDRIRLKVRLVFQKESDPGVPLVLTTDAEGLIGASEAASCRKPGTRCAPLYASDYVTELSLWDE
jgi:hypothetical protein